MEFADVNKMKTKKDRYTQEQISLFPTNVFASIIRHLRTKKMRCHRKGDSAFAIWLFNQNPFYGFRVMVWFTRSSAKISSA